MTGRRLAAAVGAAVGVVAVFVGAVLLYGVTHQPPATRPGARPAPSPPAPPPGARELRAAAAALRSAGSAHLVGAVTGPGGSTPVDLSVTDAGATGSVVVNGTTVDVVRVGDRTYLRSPQLVRDIAGGVVASLVGDRWVAVDAGRLAGTAVGEAVRSATTLDGIASLLDSAASLAPRSVWRTVDGVRVVEVVAGPTVVDVAATGPPYPLSVRAGNVGTLRLDGFGAYVDLRPPAGAVDLGGLPSLG